MAFTSILHHVGELLGNSKLGIRPDAHPVGVVVIVVCARQGTQVLILLVLHGQALLWLLKNLPQYVHLVEDLPKLLAVSLIEHAVDHQGTLVGVLHFGQVCILRCRHAVWPDCAAASSGEEGDHILLVIALEAMRLDPNIADLVHTSRVALAPIGNVRKCHRAADKLAANPVATDVRVKHGLPFFLRDDVNYVALLPLSTPFHQKIMATRK